ncbi:MAG: hypothetical protein AAGG48_31645 [Planctomycetota bacterium]
MDTTLTPPGQRRRLPYELIPTMSHSRKIRIEDVVDLLAVLAKCRVTMEWQIPPEAGHRVFLSPSQLQILVDGKPITSSRIVNTFKCFHWRDLTHAGYDSHRQWIVHTIDVQLGPYAGYRLRLL